MSDIMVSICCLTYNQEEYIKDALEGFVNQKTTFPFEILIHDDASTDGTADIIRQYEARYPELIKPIYQTENQYSKNVAISFTIQYPRAKGKYIAMCEGDDYWTDPLKLQKQVDYMESHPDCGLCFTNGQCIKNGIPAGRVVPWVQWNRKAYKPGDADYDMGEMVLLDYIPTASLLFRREDILNIPAFSPNAFKGDTCIRLYLTSLGYAHCIDEDTCVYRFRVSGSLTTQWNANAKKSLAFMDKLICLLDDMNRLTDFRYNSEIEELKLRTVFKQNMTKQDYRAARKKEFHELHRRDGGKVYAKYLLNVYCPGLYETLRRAKAARKHG
jgi:glycosyltransferase involved in cell wall biosynthesis